MCQPAFCPVAICGDGIMTQCMNELHHNNMRVRSKTRLKGLKSKEGGQKPPRNGPAEQALFLVNYSSVLDYCRMYTCLLGLGSAGPPWCRESAVSRVDRCQCTRKKLQQAFHFNPCTKHYYKSKGECKHHFNVIIFGI